MAPTKPKARPKRERQAGPDKAHLERVKSEFATAGVSVAEWARVNGFARMTVVDVLRGTRVGLRGEAHRVAVALGLKKGRVVDVKLFRPGVTAAQSTAL